MSEIETKRKREVADDNRPTFQVTKAPTLRRTGAFLCDLLSSFIFGIFFLSCGIVYVFDAI